MKGLICYYSSTGNTKLACQYIAHHVSIIKFDLLDITLKKMPDFNSYLIVGFATFTDYFGPPFLFEDFLKKIPMQNFKYAFIFNTFGGISGKTLKVLNKMVSSRGFKVIAGHSLHTPENYPPNIIKGLEMRNAPSKRKLQIFNNFILNLNQKIKNISDGCNVKKAKIKIGIINNLLPVYSRKHAKKVMDKKYIDKTLCTKCGICKNVCPYEVIKLNPYPVFNEEKCFGCWSCFNHCPTKAIYTKKIYKKGHYPLPIDKLKEKLK